MKATIFLIAKRWCTALFLCAVPLVAVTAAQAAERTAKEAAASDTPQAVRNGELVFHGNYCGVGNRAGAEPIDALDVACMHHDACTPTGKVQSCACNARLAEEAGAVASDPRQPAELKSLAALTASAATAGLAFCAPSAPPAEPAAKVSPQPVGTAEPAATDGDATVQSPLPPPVSLEPPQAVIRSAP